MKPRDYELDQIVEQTFRAIADYDAAALRARTSWDDHTAAFRDSPVMKLTSATSEQKLTGVLYGAMK
jgi:hypothetical protein